MKRIEQTRDWVHYLATSLAVLGGIWLDRNIENRLDSTIKYLLIGSVIIVFFVVLELCLRLCLNTSYWVRKLIIGKHDIEGWWVDVVVDPKNKQPMFGAVFRIDYENDEYLISGQDFNPDGSIRGGFTSTQSMYDRYILNYRFDTHLMNEPRPSEGGTGILNFIRRGSAPIIAFSGFLFDPHRLANLYVYGEKISDSKLIDQLQTSEWEQASEASQKAALDYINERWLKRFKSC